MCCKLGFLVIISPSSFLIRPSTSVTASAPLVVKCSLLCKKKGHTHQQLRKDRRPFVHMHRSYPRCRWRPNWGKHGTTSGRGGPQPQPSGEPSVGPWTPQRESWSPWEGSGNPVSGSLDSSALNLCQEARSVHAEPGRQKTGDRREGLEGL